MKNNSKLIPKPAWPPHFRPYNARFLRGTAQKERAEKPAVKPNLIEILLDGPKAQTYNSAPFDMESMSESLFNNLIR